MDTIDANGPARAYSAIIYARLKRFKERLENVRSVAAHRRMLVTGSNQRALVSLAISPQYWGRPSWDVYIFQSSLSDDPRNEDINQHNGKNCRIVRRATANNGDPIDPAIRDGLIIRFDDGRELLAWACELRRPNEENHVPGEAIG